MKDFSELEKNTNDLLSLVRDLEYLIQLFAEKSNATNALKVRNLLKELSIISNLFKKNSIEVFKK